MAPEPVTLSTERLVLRPYRFEDIDDLLVYAQDDRWSQFMPVPRPYKRADGEQWIARAVLIDWDVEPTWALEFESRCSGGVSVRPDQAHGTAEFGYSLSRELWGRGLTQDWPLVKWPNRRKRPRLSHLDSGTHPGPRRTQGAL